MKKNSTDYFECHNWDYRIFLINSGGSHHFAAAWYIANRIGEQFPHHGKLYRFGLNVQAITDLLNDFEIFVIGEAEEFNVEFNDAVRYYQADYYYCDLPKPYTDRQAIFLPRQKERSIQVAEIFKSEGFFDLGKYLMILSRNAA